jgi:hypothetical protein
MFVKRCYRHLPMFPEEDLVLDPLNTWMDVGSLSTVVHISSFPPSFPLTGVRNHSDLVLILAVWRSWTCRLPDITLRAHTLHRRRATVGCAHGPQAKGKHGVSDRMDCDTFLQRYLSFYLLVAVIIYYLYFRAEAEANVHLHPLRKYTRNIII